MMTTTKMLSSSTWFLCIVLFLLQVYIAAAEINACAENSSEENERGQQSGECQVTETADAKGTTMMASETMTTSRIRVVPIASNPHHPSASFVLVVDRFLDPNLVSALVQNVTAVNDNNRSMSSWKPVIPYHQPGFTLEDSLTEEGLFVPFSNKPRKGQRQTSTNTNQQEVGGGFPGLRTNLTQAYEEALRGQLEELTDQLVELFHLRPDKDFPLLWNRDSFIGNVCYHPDHWTSVQRQPHVDEGFVIDPKSFKRRPIRLAVVHYLQPPNSVYYHNLGHKPRNNDNPTGDGTAFYADIVANETSRFDYGDCRALQDYAKNEKGWPRGSRNYYEASSCFCPPRHDLCRKALAERVNDNKTTTNSNVHYKLLQHVPYQYNRAVLYPAKMLHSAYIATTTTNDSLPSLSCWPDRGRLTANVFLG